MIGMKFSQKLEFASVGLNWTVGDVMWRAIRRCGRARGGRSGGV